MSLTTLGQFLDSKHIKYTVISHSVAYTAQRHRTLTARAGIDRYAIVAESDMVDAIERVEALRAQIGHNQQESEPKVVQNHAPKSRGNLQ